MRLAIAATIAIALGGAFAPPAEAHIRTGILASSFRASVDPDVVGGIHARIQPTDLALDLQARPHHVALVLGYIGEPFLRLDDSGAWASERSPTAATVGLLRPGKRMAPSAGGWRRLSAQPRAMWHDARIRGVWSIPVLMDGRRVELHGEVERVSRPPAWPWLVFGLPFLAGLVAVLVERRPRRLARAAVLAGTVAGLATTLNAVGFALAPSASRSSWVVGGNEAVVAVVGLSVLVFGRGEARLIAAGVLGLMAVFAGLSQLAVFTHGIVFTDAPDTLARLATASAICAGAFATTTSAFFLDPRHARLLRSVGGARAVSRQPEAFRATSPMMVASSWERDHIGQ